jgi:chromosome segregation ATPase
MEAMDAVRDIYAALDDVLGRFNKLEELDITKDTGMISQYEEENRNLKSELDIKTDECDALISRVFKQDDEYTKLEAENKELRETNGLIPHIHRKLWDESVRITMENEELCSKCESKEDALKKMIHEVAELEKEKIDLEVRLAQSDELRYRAAKYAWAIKTVLKKASYSPGHVAEELRFMAKKSTTPKDVFERWEVIANELLGEHSKLIDKINRLEKENKDLKEILTMCEQDANMAQSLCHNIAFNAERARNKTPWFNE